MEYKANRNTAIFPFGLIAKGEALRQEHITALGEEALAELVERGVLVKIGGPAPVDGNMGAAATEGDEADQADAEIDDAEDEADQADAPEDELAGLDDLMGEAEDEPEAKPDAKPAKKEAKGRKAK